MTKVSVIIPVFNVENYLEKCLESLLSQTFDDMEILLINDGSTDISGEICCEFSKKDRRIRVFNQKNSGVSVARNNGIELSEGKYITFVDSDDYVEEDMIEFLVKNLEENDVDISTCGVCNCYITNDSIVKEYDKNPNQSGVINSKEALGESLINGKVALFSCGKLYKRELFGDLKFPEGMIYEDVAIIPTLMTKIKSLHYSFAPKYYYIRHSKSITGSKFKEKDLDMIKANQKNFDLVKNCHEYAIKQAEFRLLWSYIHLIDKIICSDSDFPELNNMLELVKSRKYDILKNKYFTLKRKLMFVLMVINFRFYKKVIKYFNKSRRN